MIASYLTSLQELVHAHKQLAILAVGLIAFGESLAIVALFLPLFSALVALGAMLGTQQDTLLQAWLAASIGAAAGYWASYALAFHFSDRLDAMVRRSKSRLAIERAEDLFRKWGLWAVLAGRFSKPVRSTITLVAGMTRMPALPFQIANVVSAVAWTAFVLFSGASLSFLQRFWN